MAGANLLGRRVLAKVLVVVALHVFTRDFYLRCHVGGLDAHELDLALLGNAVLLLVGVEVRRNLGVARVHLVLEVVRQNRDDVEHHFLVLLLVFLLELLVGNRHPFREAGAELVEHARRREEVVRPDRQQMLGHVTR